MSRVIIAGSINMDVVATADRHPNIGESVVGGSLNFIPGGKGANQAVAAAKGGAKTILIGKVGQDLFARALLDFLKDCGIELRVSQTALASTGTALITVTDGDNAIVAVPGANALLTPPDLSDVAIHANDVCCSQCEIPLETIQAFFIRAKQAGAFTILNNAPAKELSNQILSLTDLLVVNESELQFMTKIEPRSGLPSIHQAIALLKQRGTRNVIVTLGAQGARADFDGQSCSITGHSVVAVDSTGAGDCFVGSLAARVSHGDDLMKAVEFANAAAALSVTRKGAGPGMPAETETRKFMEARK
jgi:ribokinase